MKAFVTANTKRVAVCILVSFGLVSQALAVLRPLFPAKPAPPFSGEGIVIGNTAYCTLLRGDLSHVFARSQAALDRKSTRLNSSHGYISYAVFCLKKKKQKHSTAKSLSVHL